MIRPKTGHNTRRKRPESSRFKNGARVALPALLLWLAAPPGLAETALTNDARRDLARAFVERMRDGFERADQRMEQMQEPQQSAGRQRLTEIPEGEMLVFQVRLPQGLRLSNPLLGTIYQGQVTLSVMDIIRELDFSIERDPDTGNMTGWYLREEKTFALNKEARHVTSDQGHFAFSSFVHDDQNDLYATPQEIAAWFGLDIVANPHQMTMQIDSDIPFPVQERRNRRDQHALAGRMARAPDEPQLPYHSLERQMIGVPIVNIQTSSIYRKSGTSDTSNFSNAARIATRGDFAYGTLRTNSRITDEGDLTLFRANYLRESHEADLLGPLQARRYEIGDVIPVSVPNSRGTSPGLGARITNIDPAQSMTRVNTEIFGEATPGWDVEIYRDGSLIAFQEAGEDGRYYFENVDLSAGDNEFRVVKYGPQGQRQEENFQIPVASRRTNEGGVYDVSVTFADTQVYDPNRGSTRSPDRGNPNISAYYETALSDRTALSAGASTRESDGERESYLYTGISHAMWDTLFNADVTADQDGDMLASLSARRLIGAHRFRNSAEIRTDGFGGDSARTRRFQNTMSLSGPLGMRIGNTRRGRVNYNLSAGYGHYSDGDDRYSLSGGLSTSIRNWGMGQSLNYSYATGSGEDRIGGASNLMGRIGQNRLRFRANYDIHPDYRVTQLSASYARRLAHNLSFNADLVRRPQRQLTEGSAGLNWSTPYASFSPRVSYNSVGDFTAALTTRFGLAYDPQAEHIRMMRNINADSAAMSVFVFLDKDGNGIFSDGDIPIPSAVIRTPQNSGRAVTGEDGHAFFNRMTSMRPTDVFLDPMSLGDPYWVPGFEGVSVVPRRGYVAQLQFPVHMAGEVDGEVFASSPDGERQTLRGMRLTLYDMNGRAAYQTVSGFDGFYLFETVAPGTYYLLVDPRDLRHHNVAQPAPEIIEIGYDGTILYGTNINLDSAMPVGFAFPQDYDDFIAAHPHAALPADGSHRLVMNMGQYHSNLLMALTWYRLHSRYGAILQGATPLVSPAHSVAYMDKQTHTLKLDANTADFREAGKKCRALAARGFECTIEIHTPELLQKASYTP